MHAHAPKPTPMYTITHTHTYLQQYSLDLGVEHIGDHATLGNAHKADARVAECEHCLDAVRPHAPVVREDLRAAIQLELRHYH